MYLGGVWWELARAWGKSAKALLYQPNKRGNQPKYGYISQTREEISQSTDISAKQERKSAKAWIYQPNKRGNQPKHGYISQTREEISQSMVISANHHPKIPPYNFSPNKTAINRFSNTISVAFGLLFSSLAPSSQSAAALSWSPFTYNS